MANPPAAARYGKQPAAGSQEARKPGSGKPGSQGAGSGSPAGEPHHQDIAAGGGSRCARVLVNAAPGS